ncbi:phage resistance protein [Virgisporangium aurantiacum]|uniref:phage resistance protein n=1 Tax=Virgisporangium aurantiacum TaxID=175570 RepID=UPI00194FFD31|nr:phage resistance protein [Virgisporangium aurantiacum]
MSQQPLLRDLIDIPPSVGEGDFVVRAAEGADLKRYVVTDALRANFEEALSMVGHAVQTGRSQAKFLHGSFGSGKSHFMAVLRELLQHNPDARALKNIADPVTKTDPMLRGKKILTLTFHMLDARSVEQAVLEGYLNQIMTLHPEAPLPAVHRSDALLGDAARLHDRMGDEAFFAALTDAGAPPGAQAGSESVGLAAMMARRAGWTAETYAAAAAQPPGTKERDGLVSALTTAFFTGAVRSGEYLDLDAGLAVVTRHAKDLGYDALVLFLDEFILWLSTHITDHTFVNTEGAKLNKLVESADAHRPLPIASFVARQRNLEDFLGPQVGGTERQALADMMTSVQGRLGNIVLADTNLPAITAERLLRPNDDAAKATIDRAFTAVRGNRAVWDILLLGAQYGDAGIGSDAAAFRSLYPFSPALVASLVALSQALQRERTALRIMTELLVERRDTLRVNDLIGVAELFEPLVLAGELPDEPKLKQRFQSARETYRGKLRPLLLAHHSITAEQAAGHEPFQLDDKLIKTLLLGALVPDVPALHNLTASKLHALNFGSIASPIPGYENQIVLGRLQKLQADAGELHITKDPDPVVSLTLSEVDYDKLLDLVPSNETGDGVLQQLVRDLVCSEMGLSGVDGTLGEISYLREWRGRKHTVHVRFGNVRDDVNLPESTLLADGETWRINIDYPFDVGTYDRGSDFARIELFPRGSRTVFWQPFFLSADMVGRVRLLAKVNYLLGTDGGGDRLQTLADDWSVADRKEGRVYLQQRQHQLRDSLLTALKQAYGAAKAGAESTDVIDDTKGVLHTLADGLHLGDPIGGTLDAALRHLTGVLLAWSYPGKPALPDDEKAVTRGEMAKVLTYAQRAAADPTRGVVVEQADRRTVQRICNHLQLGELADNRYVLTTGTCWWSRHFTQRAAQRGLTDRYPVAFLREQLDQPDPRGFDRDLQNLIMIVFGLEHQLAWYDGSVKVQVNAVQAVQGHWELRPPPMPTQEEWDEAVRRGQPLFGVPLPVWRSPTNLADLAGAMRQIAREFAQPAAHLVAALDGRAAMLGLDPVDATGRLATARRTARLLADIAGEHDDVVRVQLVAGADLGGVDPAVAAVSFKQAARVKAAIDGAQWPLLEAISAMDDDRARNILDDLRRDARHEQHAADLVTALQTASTAAAKLLAELQPKPKPKPGLDLDPRDVEVPDHDEKVELQQATIVTQSDLEALSAKLRELIADGARIMVTWRAQ